MLAFRLSAKYPIPHSLRRRTSSSQTSGGRSVSTNLTSLTWRRRSVSLALQALSPPPLRLSSAVSPQSEREKSRMTSWNLTPCPTCSG